MLVSQSTAKARQQGAKQGKLKPPVSRPMADTIYLTRNQLVELGLGYSSAIGYLEQTALITVKRSVLVPKKKASKRTGKR